MPRFVSVRTVGRRIDEAERQADLVRVMRASKDEESPLSAFGRGALSATALMTLGGAGVSPADSSGSADPLSSSAPAAALADELEVDPQVFSPAAWSTLPEVDGGQYFHPDDNRPLRRVSGRPMKRSRAAASVNPAVVPWGIGATAKSSVLMCIRRYARRGVLLALGQGGGSHKKPRRSETSDIWC